MPPAFGFSVGDFSSAKALIDQTIEAIREPRGPSTEYRHVILELEALKRALRQIEALETTDQNVTYVNAIRGMALACQLPIRKYLDRARHYEMSTAPWPTSNNLRPQRKNAKWKMLSSDEEIEKFRAVIAAKVISINVLLSFLTMQHLENAHHRTKEVLLLDEGDATLQAADELQTAADGLPNNATAEAEQDTGRDENDMSEGSSASLWRLSKLIMEPISIFPGEMRTFIGKVLRSNWQTYQYYSNFSTTSQTSQVSRWYQTLCLKMLLEDAESCHTSFFVIGSHSKAFFAPTSKISLAKIDNMCYLNFLVVQPAPRALKSGQSSKVGTRKDSGAKRIEAIQISESDGSSIPLDAPQNEDHPLPPSTFPQPSLDECFAGLDRYANARRKGHVQDADDETLRTLEADHDFASLRSLLNMSSVPSLAGSSASSVSDYEDLDYDTHLQKDAGSDNDPRNLGGIDSFRNINIEIEHQTADSTQIKWQIPQPLSVKTKEKELLPSFYAGAEEANLLTWIPEKDLASLITKDREPEAEASREGNAKDHNLHMRFTSLDHAEPLCILDKIKAYAENVCRKPIVWWPLRPRKVGPLPGFTQISWKCCSGRDISVVMLTKSASAYKKIPLTPRSPSGPMLPFVQPPTPAAASTKSSSSISWPWNLAELPYMISSKADVTNRTRSQRQPTGECNELYLYWCVDTLLFRTASDYITVLRDLTKDHHLVGDLKRKYRALRGWRWWISLMTCSGIRFVEFGRIQADGAYVKCLKLGIPHHSDIEYEYELCAPNEDAHTMILEATVFHHFHEGCCPASEDIVRGIPKRKKLLESKYGITAFGMHAQQGLAFSKFLVFFFGGLAGPFAFAIWYLTWNPWDLQNAFCLVFLMLGVISVLVLLPDLKIP